MRSRGDSERYRYCLLYRCGCCLRVQHSRHTQARLFRVLVPVIFNCVLEGACEELLLQIEMATALLLCRPLTMRLPRVLHARHASALTPLAATLHARTHSSTPVSLSASVGARPSSAPPAALMRVPSPVLPLSRALCSSSSSRGGDDDGDNSSGGKPRTRTGGIGNGPTPTPTPFGAGASRRRWSTATTRRRWRCGSRRLRSAEGEEGLVKYDPENINFMPPMLALPILKPAAVSRRLPAVRGDA